MGIYAVRGELMLCICMRLNARDILSICTMEATRLCEWKKRGCSGYWSLKLVADRSGRSGNFIRLLDWIRETDRIRPDLLIS